MGEFDEKVKNTVDSVFITLVNIYLFSLNNEFCSILYLWRGLFRFFFYCTQNFSIDFYYTSYLTSNTIPVLLINSPTASLDGRINSPGLDSVTLSFPQEPPMKVVLGKTEREPCCFPIYPLRVNLNWKLDSLSFCCLWVKWSLNPHYEDDSSSDQRPIEK